MWSRTVDKFGNRVSFLEQSEFFFISDNFLLRQGQLDLVTIISTNILQIPSLVDVRVH